MASRTRILDQLQVHTRAGTLSSDLATRNRPREAIISEYLTFDDPVVEVMWPTAVINTNYWRSFLLAKSYAAFFPPEDEAPNPCLIVGGLASMLTNILPPRQVSRDGELRNAIERAGMKLRFIDIDTIEKAEEISREPEVIAFLDRFEVEAVPTYQDDRAQQILCVGILLLTIGKNVNPNNYEGWIKNRIRTFSGALGIPEGRCIWTEAQCPSQEALNTSYSFLSACFSLRRLLFLICVSAARDTRRLAAIFREVVMFLQGVEMGHLLMIDRYIFNKYPELLRIRSLRDNMDSMNAAWAYLASLDPGDRYFAKLLFTKDETAALNRNNFTLLSSAAIAAAQFEIPSMRFYQGGNVIAASGAIADSVKSYLFARVNMVHIAVMQSPYSYMTELEKKKYLEQAEALRAGASLLELPERIPSAEPRQIGRVPHELLNQ